MQPLLQQVVQYNNWRREDASSFHLLTSWADLLGVLLGKRYPAVCTLLEAEPGAHVAVISEILFAVLELLPAENDTRCVPLLRCIHVILSKLSDAESSSVTLAPSSCHTIFRILLSALLRSDRSDATRHFACSSLLAHLRLCRSPRWALDDEEFDSPLATSLRNELDAGNLAELRRQEGRLLAVLVRDSLSGSEQGRTASLALLEALLCAAPGAGAVLEPGIFSSGLPAAVASAVERTPRSVLLLSPLACRRAIEALQAQLCFLIALARCTPSGPAQLVSCGTVSHLAGCTVLDTLPEECSEPTVQRAVILPALQLVAVLLELAPDSVELSAQALSFCTAHSDCLLRMLVLDESSLPSSRVAAVLLSRLVSRDPAQGSCPALLRFRDALERACWQFFELDPAVLGGGACASHLFAVQSVITAHVRYLVGSKRASLAQGSSMETGSRVGMPSVLIVSRLISHLTGSLFGLLRTRHELATGMEQGDAAEHARRTDVLGALACVDVDVRLVLLTLENALEAVHSTITVSVDARLREQLSYELAPVLEDLARLADDDLGRETPFLRLLSRRLGALLVLSTLHES